MADATRENSLYPYVVIEDDVDFPITGSERDALVEAGLIRFCRECGDGAGYHFHKAETWSDIDRVIRAVRREAA